MITRDALLSFLDAKSVSMDCPSCAQNNWIIGAEEEEFSGMILVPDLQTPGLSISGKHTPTAYLVCNNCGYIRSYAKAVIHRWLEARKEAVEEANIDRGETDAPSQD